MGIRWIVRIYKERFPYGIVLQKDYPDRRIKYTLHINVYYICRACEYLQ